MKILLDYFESRFRAWYCEGVGGYTSAAIASISLGERIAVVDANVMRILARLRCLDWDLKNVKQYGKLANALVDPHRPGDFNQVIPMIGLAFFQLVSFLCQRSLQIWDWGGNAE